jgi:uncharacterized protein
VQGQLNHSSATPKRKGDKAQRMWEDFLRAFCLMLIFEGVVPFLYPNRWRRLVAVLAPINDKNIRLMGLSSVAIGLAVLLLLRA